MIRRPLVLKDGKKTELPQGDKVPGLSTLSLCDISLFSAGLFEALLTNQFAEILTDQHGFPLGLDFPMMPKACLAEYDNGLSDQNAKYLFGTEGEMLI